MEHAANERDGEIGLEVRAVIPAERRHAVAGDDAEVDEGAGEAPGPVSEVAHRVAMNRFVREARDDLLAAVESFSPAENRGQGERIVHHQAVHAPDCKRNEGAGGSGNVLPVGVDGSPHAGRLGGKSREKPRAAGPRPQAPFVPQPRHAAIGVHPGCRGTARRVEANGLLPDSRRDVEDRPNSGRIAACVDGVDRGGPARRAPAAQRHGVQWTPPTFGGRWSVNHACRAAGSVALAIR